jgi:hypothetical protein
MFAGKVRSLLPQREAPERCSTWVSSGLNRKHQTRLERLARDKLVWNINKLSCKKVYNTDLWTGCKFFSEANRLVYFLGAFEAKILLNIDTWNMLGQSDGMSASLPRVEFDKMDGKKSSSFPFPELSSSCQIFLRNCKNVVGLFATMFCRFTTGPVFTILHFLLSLGPIS